MSKNNIATENGSTAILASIQNCLEQLTQGVIPKPLHVKPPDELTGIVEGMNTYIEQVSKIKNVVSKLSRMTRYDFSSDKIEQQGGMFGDLVNCVNDMQDQLEAVTDTLKSLARGEVYKIDEYKAINDNQGKYCDEDELTPAIIGTMENFSKNAVIANAIAAGDFSLEIIPASDEDFLTKAMLLMRAQIEGLQHVITNVVYNIIDGRISHRIKSRGIPGKWGTIAKQINKALDATVAHIDTIPIPISIINTKGEIQFLNHSALEMYKVSARDGIGRQCGSLCNSDKCQDGSCAVMRAIADDAVLSDEMHISSDVSERIYQFTGTPIKNLEGEIVGALEFLIDKTSEREITSSVTKSAMDLSAVVNDITGSSDTLHDKTASLNQQIALIVTASEELTVTMNDLSKASSVSSDNITMISTSTEELTATISEIANNAAQASLVTSTAVENVDTASKRVTLLNDAAKGISNVTETILEISDQTKLLALNATIEAARAGEAGKGFAVVASEVKELAQQTNTATVDIRKKIEAIQNATNQTISVISDISEVISEVKDFVNMIATATEEQSITTKDIAENVAATMKGIAQVSHSVSQAAIVTQEVAKNISTANSNVSEIDSQAELMGNVMHSLMNTHSKLNEAVKKFEF